MDKVQILLSARQLSSEDDFLDAVFDNFVEAINERNRSPDALGKHVYTSQTKDSPHMKPVVDFTLATLNEPFYEKLKKSTKGTFEFFADLLLAVSSSKKNFCTPGKEFKEFFNETKMCDYHLHTVKKTPCYKTRC